MKQVLQSYRTGELRVAEVPAPGVAPGCVLVHNVASVVSVGTERAVLELGKKSLLGKARARPDLVKKVLDRVSREGVVGAGTAAFRRLDQPIPLGYSCAGKVIAIGSGISGLSIGDRVACAGAKVANHAEINLVPQNLCARVPDAVDDETAAFATVGAIALQGIRGAAPTLGETFAVIGLGVIGQLVVQLLQASGCAVLGVDLDPRKVALARKLGANAAIVRNEDVRAAALGMTLGRGVDGVIIAAATPSNDPIELAGDLCRDRARIVVVGVVGMQVPRRPYYDKELTLLQSRSYGAGRYDPSYEDRGVDYPIGYVRWTEQRNLEAFLAQCAEGRIRVAPLISHRFALAQAEEAYALVGGSAPGAEEPLAVLLTYDERPETGRTVSLRTEAAKPFVGDTVRAGVVGAGAFASGILVPALAAAGKVRMVSIASARGLSARHLAERYGFERCTTDAESLIADPEIDAVVIATRHDLHASQAELALRAGKHVFVEKPLALTEAQLSSVVLARRGAGQVLVVGYNRRFSPLVQDLTGFFTRRKAPLVLHYRINAGEVPSDSWIHDPQTGGGRIVGEVCHFVDLCSHVVGALPTSVFAQAVGPAGAARSDDNVTLFLRFADGSIATIAYVATGDPRAGKERLEVVDDGAVAVLEDFRLLELYRGGKRRVVRKLAQDKGHRAEMVAFLSAVRSGALPISIESMAATSRATFAAVESIESGAIVPVPAHV